MTSSRPAPGAPTQTDVELDKSPHRVCGPLWNSIRQEIASTPVRLAAILLA